MKNLIRGVFLLFALSVCSQAAYGCMCTPPKHLYKVSKAVFFGELVEIAQSDVGDQRVVKFKVEKYWKGINGESVSIMTTAVYPCGYNFRVGEKYLIYAGEENSRLKTAPCRILAEGVAGDNLKKLGKGKIPKPSMSLPLNAPPRQ